MDDAAARLAEVSQTIVGGVARLAPGYLAGATGRVLDAWGRVPDRSETEARLHGAIRVATERVVRELEDLFTVSAADQTRTPLQIVRTLTREPTDVLRAAGVPPVVRDEFATRTVPDDEYGLAPMALADLGDPEMGPLQLAWGIAKTAVIRSGPGG